MMVERSLAEVDFSALCSRTFFPSPSAWEDQVLYSLMLDRFSDGSEAGYKGNSGRTVRSGMTPLFGARDAGGAVRRPQEAARWREAGAGWVGGTLRGLASKMGYLARLGVTAIRVSPVFRQAAYERTYHGYGAQNFLDVDPHFGGREDLRRMVDAAHRHGIYVILDIVLQHAGNVFAYDPGRHWTWDQQRGVWYLDPRWDGRPYAVQGFRDAQGLPAIPFVAAECRPDDPAWPDGAIWPIEFRDPALFSRQGHLVNWNHRPECLGADFFDFKDLTLGEGPDEAYRPSPALRLLCRVTEFWIAYADLDGLCVGSVRHLDLGAVRFLASTVREFARRLGKERFWLIGEITGDRESAVALLEQSGLDAASGVAGIPDALESLSKGAGDPQRYFETFRHSLRVRKASHTWFRDKLITHVDDYDQIRKGLCRARFCAGSGAWKKLVLGALALNVTTLGIPCIYYGTEQGFDGAGGDDRFVREAMFGGTFGPFRSRGRHCFDEEHPIYRALAAILAIRKQRPILRRGRQYLREISGDGETFGLPQPLGGVMRSVVPWSRLLDDQEMLLAVNTDPARSQTAWVVVDAALHQDGDRLRCLYSTAPRQIGEALPVKTIRQGLNAVRLRVPAAGFVIYE